MRKKKKEKQFRESFWAALFSTGKPVNLDEQPTHLEHVRMRLWDRVEDVHLELMVTHIRSINMLDLDETDLTNEGIEHLTRLDLLKELRLKGIRQLDNDCIVHLNKLKGLELLHLRGTSITLDGILKLNNLQGLKELFFSDDEDKPAKEKMLQLREVLPGCEFIINGKSYSFEDEQDYYQ